jgi:hypothetical protein
MINDSIAYYVYDNVREQQQSGPFDIYQLQLLLKTSKIDLECLVWCEGEADWVTLSNSIAYKTILNLENANKPPPPPPKAPKPAVIENNKRESIRQSRMSLTKRESTRTVSQRFLRAQVLDRQEYIWTADDKDVWALCKVLGQDNTVLTIQNITNQTIKSIDSGFQDILKYNHNIVPDMTSFQYLHEPAILHNLIERGKILEPYTYMGLVLVAMNPLQWISPPHIDDYCGKSLSPENPHPYAIAGNHQ